MQLIMMIQPTSSFMETYSKNISIEYSGYLRKKIMVKKIIAFLKIILFNPIMIQTLITGFNFKLGLKGLAKWR